MEAFLDARDGACSNGIREINRSPEIMTFATFGDAITPSRASVSDQVPSGGYVVKGKTFAGRA